MKGVVKYIFIVMVFLLFSTSSINANEKQGVSHEEYLRDIKQHLNNSDLSKIKQTNIINIKAISKGMDSGYIEPRIELFINKKAEIDELVLYIEGFKINDEHLSKKHIALINKLRNMSYYLEYAQEKHETALDEKYYILKYMKLALDNKFDDGTCNYNIRKYNKNIDDIEEIVKDMKEINETEYKNINE